jgi:hypothetical protein
MKIIFLLGVLSLIVFIFTANASISDGLVGKYLFNGLSTKIHDDSGNGFDGYVWPGVHCVSSCADRFGENYAYCFNPSVGDCSTVFIDLPGDPFFVFSQKFSVSLWMYVPSSGLFGLVYSAWVPVFATYGYSFGFDPASVLTSPKVSYFDPTLTTHSLNSHITLDQWNHVVITKGRDYLRVYVNNVLDATLGPLTASESLVANPGTGGYGYTFQIGYLFTGRLDDFFIYNRELSSSEVSSLYNLTSAENILPPSSATDTDSSSASTDSATLTIAIVIPIGVVVIGIFIYLSCYFRILRKNQNNTSPISTDDLFSNQPVAKVEMIGSEIPTAVKFSSLANITDNQMPLPSATNVTPSAPPASSSSFPTNSYSSLFPSTTSTYQQNPPVYHFNSSPPISSVGPTYPTNGQMTTMSIGSPTVAIPTSFASVGGQVVPYSVLSESRV